jgi:hypothetical protein
MFKTDGGDTSLGDVIPSAVIPSFRNIWSSWSIQNMHVIANCRNIAK